MKIGHDLVDVRDQYASDSESRSPSGPYNNPDEAIIHEVQPLVKAQATYIDQLEFEMSEKVKALSNLEQTIG